MTSWLRNLLGAIVGLLVVAGPATAHAGWTVAKVDQQFQASVACSRDLVSIVRDIEKTRDLKARGKSPNASVKPKLIAGEVYLDKLLTNGPGGGVINRCKTAYSALTRHKVMALIPTSWKAPGSTVEKGATSLNAARIAAAALKNTGRMRLSAVNRLISQLRGHANQFLQSVNGLKREARKLEDHSKQKPSAGPAKHFDALRTCASKMATLANQMKSYRKRTYRGKKSNFQVAPRAAVGARNIDDIMKKGGWLDKCVAQHAAMTRNPMKRHLPADFLKPHYGAHTRMKTALGAIRINGAFLKGTSKQQLRKVDAMLGNLLEASRDFLGHANHAYRHASGR